MNKIELYLDREEKLTLEFFMNQDSEFSMSKIKGIQTYGIIREVCKQKIIDVRQNLRDNEITVIYDNCILHINEVSYTLSKRGTAQLRDNIAKYLECKKRREVEKEQAKANGGISKPLKVKRKNKHIGAKIAAVGLTLLYVGAVIAANTVENKKDYVPYAEPTTYTETIEVTEPTTDSILIVDKVDNSNLEFKYEIIDIEDACINIPIDYEDRSRTEKAKTAKAYYYSTIEKYAKRYGLDPKLVMGIATQERGIHSETMDPGGATGLMQIQNSAWVGEKLTAYNYEKGEYETVTVTKEDLSDVFKNIRYGCMIFQTCIRQMDNNMIAAIQCYNMGYGNMMKIFKSYSAEVGKNVKEILADFEDYGWLEHRDIIRVGDQKYLEHVFSWIGTEVNINASDLRGNDVNLKVTNETESKSISIN